MNPPPAHRADSAPPFSATDSWSAARPKALAAAALAALAFIGASLPLRAQEEHVEHWYDDWFVRGGFRALYNVKASVQQIIPTVQPGKYEDGFVLPDVGGAASGLTWYWGYQNASQISSDQYLTVSRLTGQPVSGDFNDATDNPSLGGEILIGTEFFRFELGKREARVGFEMGYAYNDFTVEEHSSVTSTATLVRDVHSLNGITPPLPPYAGTFNGPGPIISLNRDAGRSQVIQSPSQGTTRSELHSDIHTFKAGIWMEYPLSRQTHLSLSLGYASVLPDTQLTYTESINYDRPEIPDVPATPKTIGGREWRPGVYSQLRFGYDFTSSFGAYLGADVQYNESLDFKDDGRKVSLDFGPAFATSLGLSFRF